MVTDSMQRLMSWKPSVAAVIQFSPRRLVVDCEKFCQQMRFRWYLWHGTSNSAAHNICRLECTLSDNLPYHFYCEVESSQVHRRVLCQVRLQDETCRQRHRHLVRQHVSSGHVVCWERACMKTARLARQFTKGRGSYLAESITKAEE